VIVLDTTVLVYAAGSDHPLRNPSRRLVEAVGAGQVRATTTVEVIQEFVHVRARRRGREDAARLGRAYSALLSPLISLVEDDLEAGLTLFERHPELGAFDAVLAAAARARSAEALVSADTAFGAVPELRYVDPATRELDELLR
jgi:predicted nucleic acid-binding protein